MYSDNIDEILDDILNKSYTSSKKILKTSSTKPDVEKFMVKFMSSYQNELLDYYKDPIIQKSLIETYEKYVLMYILINISNHFSEKEFINYLLSFGKNAIFNSMVLQIKTIMVQIVYISKNIKHIQEKKIILDKNYEKSIAIFNELGEEFTSNLKSSDIYHSVIKFILYKQSFSTNDKVNIYVLIEEYELTFLESKFIEIVESTSQEINYVLLEKLLHEKEYDDSFISEIHDMLSQDDPEEYTLDDKIDIIFKRRLLIPIVDDFLRYHKNTETYDDSTNIDPNIRSNKKNNTKIKYIINKMNDIIDYYNNGNVKNFYQPLFHRKAVLINNVEETDIIKKLNNTQNKTDEQIGHYEEMILLKKYPYQNFRDFKKNGFAFNNTKPIEAIRYSNIEFLNDEKYDFAKSNNIDWRMMTTYNYSNVVGLALPTSLGKKSYLCSVINSLENISNKKNNNICNTIKVLKNQLIMNSKSNDILYWIFDKSKDTMKKFHEVENFSQDEYFKFIMGYIYDEISEMTYEHIINMLNQYTFTNFHDALKYVNHLEKQLIPLTECNKSKVYEYLFLKKSTSHIDEYDLKQDYIPGISSKLVPIVKIKDKKSLKRDQLMIVSKETIVDDIIDVYENSQCQHLITWDRIRRLRIKHPNHFNNKLHLFIKEYAMENLEKQLICKSCSEIINLKRYLSDWKSTTEEGITMTMSLHTALENISEYEKYSVSIKNIEKILEKIAGSIGLNYFIGSSPSIKLRRQEITKTLIDFIGMQFNLMNKMDGAERKQRVYESEKKYGISAQITQFFFFELKNEIFTFSSKEVDKYKKPKLNNIVVYMVLLLLNEMTENVIEMFPNEKMLNYYIFDKIGFDLFNNIYIRINSSNDISLIKNYKLLCYVLFILSGIVVKYNMWFGENTDKKNISNATDQKAVIHTVIDLLNNILETNSKPDKHFTYEAFGVKFFTKLRELYSNNVSESIIDTIKESINKKISVLGNNKIIFKTTVEKEILLKPYFEKDEFGIYTWPHNPPELRMTKFRNTLKPLQVYSKKEYDILRTKISSKKQNPKKNIHQFNTRKYKEHIVNNIENNESDLYEHIEKTIKGWEDIIGSNVKLGNKLFLRSNVYTIDHDHRGNSIEKVMTFIESDNKIIFKKNDPYFNINVYYYFIKEKNIYMFYNAQTYNYMGYKDGKDYITILGSNKGLMPTYSIKNKLLYLGYEKINNALSKDLQEIIGTDLLTPHTKLTSFVSDIIRKRVRNLKNTLINIQRIIYQMISPIKRSRTEYIAKKYHGKFKELNIKKNSLKIFNNINEMIDSVYLTKLDPNVKITFEKEYLHVGNLVKLLNVDQKLVMYICDEINDFIKINDNKHDKITIISMMSDIINQEFNNHNKREYITAFTDVQRFVLMESNIYTKIEINEKEVFSDMTEEDINEMKEDAYTANEQKDALDVDIESDDEEGNTQVLRTYYGGLISD